MESDSILEFGQLSAHMTEIVDERLPGFGERSVDQRANVRFLVGAVYQSERFSK